MNMTVRLLLSSISLTYFHLSEQERGVTFGDGGIRKLFVFIVQMKPDPKSTEIQGK